MAVASAALFSVYTFRNDASVPLDKLSLGVAARLQIEREFSIPTGQARFSTPRGFRLDRPRQKAGPTQAR